MAPIATRPQGLVKLGEAIVAELASADDAVTKGATIVSDIAEYGEEIDRALHANTPPPPPAS